MIASCSFDRTGDERMSSRVLRSDIDLYYQATEEA